MKLVGFNLLKIDAEKKGEIPENLKIDTGINVVDITEVKSSFFKSKDDLLSVKFEYKIFYSPEYAEINLTGIMLLSTTSREARDVLSQWKNKKMPEEFRVNVFNLILKKSSLKALELEDELNLPTHFNLPSIKFEDSKE